MRLGLDMHGVLDKYPDQIIKIAQDVMKNNGRVYIITSQSVESVRKQIAILMTERMMSKPFWNQIFSMTDWMIQKKIPSFTNKNGEIKALREHDWNSIKGQIAIELALDLHIDATPEYADYFPPGVFLLMK